MVIEHDVKDRSGRLLARAGVELTERTLRVFQTWGITAVEVRDDERTRALGETESDEHLPHADPAIVKQAWAEVEQRFRHVDLHHPAAALLAKTVTKLLAERLTSKRHGH